MREKLFTIEFFIEPEKEEEISAELFALGVESISISGREDTSIQEMLINCIVSEQVLQDVAETYSSHLPVIKELVEDDWKYTWEKNFTGIAVTEHILVVPPALSVKEHTYKLVISLDPCDAFGAGTHPTTQLCCNALYAYLSSSELSLSEITMLDIGTGTAILAIIAQKMGVLTIDAIDVEEAAIRNATKNCAYNDCSSIQLQQANIRTFSSPQKYSLITANLLTQVIEQNISTLLSLLLPGGTLILSGIGEQWNLSMKQLFISYGMIVIEEYTLQGWKAYSCIPS